HDVLSRLRAGVDDLSVSRASLKWGIPMPNDPAHVVYVWIDALTTYLTALGYPDDAAETNREAETNRDGSYFSSTAVETNSEVETNRDGSYFSSTAGAAGPSPGRSETRSDHLFRKFWPADVHVIGKDILWFHT